MKHFDESSLGVQNILTFPGRGYETVPAVPKNSSDRVCSVKSEHPLSNASILVLCCSFVLFSLVSLPGARSPFSPDLSFPLALRLAAVAMLFLHSSNSYLTSDEELSKHVCSPWWSTVRVYKLAIFRTSKVDVRNMAS